MIPLGSGGKGPYAQSAKSPASSSVMHGKVSDWASDMKESLKGNSKKRFNTACAVVDTETGKTYYGRNRGIEENGTSKNPLLFGDGESRGILPEKTISGYAVGNCAEVDAVNNALNAGSKIENLQMMTIHATKNSFGDLKPACENCTYAFKGRIKGNYSGWEKKEN